MWGPVTFVDEVFTVRPPVVVYNHNFIVNLLFVTEVSGSQWICFSVWPFLLVSLPCFWSKYTGTERHQIECQVVWKVLISFKNVTEDTEPRVRIDHLTTDLSLLSPPCFTIPSVFKLYVCKFIKEEVHPRTPRYFVLDFWRYGPLKSNRVVMVFNLTPIRKRNMVSPMGRFGKTLTFTFPLRKKWEKRDTRTGTIITVSHTSGLLTVIPSVLHTKSTTEEK